MNEKICTKCEKVFPGTREYFFTNSSNKTDGLRPECKKCTNMRVKEYRENNREKYSNRHKKYYENNKEKLKQYQKDHRKYNQSDSEKKQKYYRKNKHNILKRKYNITLKDYENMLFEQNNICFICNEKIVSQFTNENNNVACIDHNHETGKVRALLCRSCNSGIGYFKEKISILKSAINYIKKFDNYDNKN